MTNRVTLLLIVVLTMLSLIMVKPVLAQAGPAFTVVYADNSYDVPASTSIDPYTGEPVQNPVQHVENRTLQFTIKNGPPPNRGYLYYVIRMKGSFSDNWSNISRSRATSDSEYTVLLFSSAGEEGKLYHGGSGFYFPYEGQVDFQVQAQAWGEVMGEMTPGIPFGGGSITTLFSASDWSNTQTINIDESQTPITSPETTPTPTPNEELYTNNLTPIMGATIVAVIIGAGVGLLIYLIKRK